MVGIIVGRMMRHGCGMVSDTHVSPAEMFKVVALGELLSDRLS